MQLSGWNTNREFVMKGFLIENLTIYNAVLRSMGRDVDEQLLFLGRHKWCGIDLCSATVLVQGHPHAKREPVAAESSHIDAGTQNICTFGYTNEDLNINLYI